MMPPVCFVDEDAAAVNGSTTQVLLSTQGVHSTLGVQCDEHAQGEWETDSSKQLLVTVMEG